MAMMTTSGRRLLAAVLVTMGAAVAGCGSSSRGPGASSASMLDMMGGRATVGDLAITGAYIPDPATPSTVAAYFTVANSGSQPDRLKSVTTTAFKSATVHRYQKVSSGAEEMVPLSAGAVVPAHGRLVLKPGADHVMLMRPERPVHQGQTEDLTLVFAHAGTVTLKVPVVADTGLPSSGSMAGMHM